PAARGRLRARAGRREQSDDEDDECFHDGYLTSDARGVVMVTALPAGFVAVTVICTAPLVSPLRSTQIAEHASLCARIVEFPGPQLVKNCAKFVADRTSCSCSRPRWS